MSSVQVRGREQRRTRLSHTYCRSVTHLLHDRPLLRVHAHVHARARLHASATLDRFIAQSQSEERICTYGAVGYRMILFGIIRIDR